MKVAYLLMAAYAFTLAMSSAHLASWYATTLGDLPLWLAWGLAGALELTAFLLSLVSTSILRGSWWAGGGAFAALALVWAGNTVSMHRAAPHLALWEVVAMSSFVPIGTFVVGKVVGELVRYQVAQREVHLVPPGPPSGPGVVPGAVLPGTGVVPQGDQVAQGEVHLVPQEVRKGGTRHRPAEPEPDQGGTTLAQGGMEEGLRAERLLLALRSGPASLSALAAHLGWPKTSTRRWLERLERQGLVRKGPKGWEVVR